MNEFLHSLVGNMSVSRVCNSDKRDKASIKHHALTSCKKLEAAI